MRKPNKTEIVNFLILNGGLLLTAIGVALFEAPNNFVLGGASGLSIILTSYFPNCNFGTFMLIVNVLLVVLGYIFLGRRLAGWTVYSSVVLSLFVAGIQAVFPAKLPLTDDMMLEMIFAVMVPSVGIAIAFSVGASTGGTDIFALILNKYTGMQVGRALFLSDVLFLLIAPFRFDARTCLYCILGNLARIFVVDGVIESFHVRKVCTLITDDPKRIVDFILNDLERGATLSKARGAYSGNEQDVIMCCLTRAEAARLRRFSKGLGIQTFITIVNSSEIIGNGFRSA